MGEILQPLEPMFSLAIALVDQVTYIEMKKQRPRPVFYVLRADTVFRKYMIEKPRGRRYILIPAQTIRDSNELLSKIFKANIQDRVVQAVKVLTRSSKKGCRSILCVITTERFWGWSLQHTHKKCMSGRIEIILLLGAANCDRDVVGRLGGSFSRVFFWAREFNPGATKKYHQYENRPYFVSEYSRIGFHLWPGVLNGGHSEGLKIYFWKTQVDFTKKMLSEFWVKSGS